MRKALIVTAALVVAVIFFLLATVPVRPRHAQWAGDPSLPERTIPGAYHVHTTRSDGREPRDSVAAAAARAGLRFVIFTDHGDGTRVPDPPEYVSGVLCIDGVEISTNGGHYVALGMAQAPYPLGGEAAAVVEDVARLGGFGFIAHPDSPRPELAWKDWTLPFDGIEWLSADTEWRDESRLRLARALFDYLVRPGPALASVLDRPSTTLSRFDALTTRRRVMALAGHDAHGGIGRGVEDGGRRGVPIPSYESSFRTFSTRVVLDGPLSNDAAADAAAVLGAIQSGRVFTAIDAVASPAILDFRVEGGNRLSIHTSYPPGAELLLLNEERVVSRGARAQYSRTLERPTGGYRVEVRMADAPGRPPVPWLLSSPMYFLPPATAASKPYPGARIPFPGDLGWRAEHDPSTTAAIEAAPVFALSYRLGSGAEGSQFAAAASDPPGRIPYAHGISFTARSSRPMRVSVQVRVEGGQRWARSVYVDPVPREINVDIGSLLPMDGQTGAPPETPAVQSLLFVVDRTNAKPGDEGRLEVSTLVLTRRQF